MYLVVSFAIKILVSRRIWKINSSLRKKIRQQQQQQQQDQQPSRLSVDFKTASSSFEENSNNNHNDDDDDDDIDDDLDGNGAEFHSFIAFDSTSKCYMSISRSFSDSSNYLFALS